MDNKMKIKEERNEVLFTYPRQRDADAAGSLLLLNSQDIGALLAVCGAVLAFMLLKRET